MSGDDTLPSEESGGVTAVAGALPVGWDRYELGELLGKGGMGVVYKARDRRLDRTVAIKFIHGADPNLTMRLLREARAQARIDHPNVCRVYEVGEVGGRAYLAIQFVDGEPLGRAASRMSLDEKVAVLRDVAVAIQEAHRLGIIHRDLKPSNILVERTEDGRWVPVVMDFGLAREATLDGGLTMSGQLVGTPAYMSPEQARGDVHAADRRSDVYSLGATLYELMTGRPPFTEPSLAKALEQVLHVDPPAPRSLVASLPVDLETIALKCLHKDPALRYASARALADDLSRYLAGEPIEGRRLSLAQRLRVAARRHRALFVLGAWSAVAILALGAFGLRSYLATRAEREHAAERSRLAERLGRDSEQIEWLLRAAYQLPLHDTRRERDLIRERMRDIASTEHELGALGDAMVHDALGRGHLALHEWREADDELARASAGGLDTPELHAARGRALGELYNRELAIARRSNTKSQLATREQELETLYLVPAVVELDQTQAAGDAAAVLEALVALYRHELAAAEKLAIAAAERAPWLFEARKLAADAAYRAGVAELDGGNYEVAHPHLERATALYAIAEDIARSDASVHEAAAQAWMALADIELRQGRAREEAFEAAVAAADRAIAAAPDQASLYTTKASILALRASAHLAGDDPRSQLEAVAAAAQEAVNLDPRDAGAWDVLGNAHVSRGTFELFADGDAEPWLRKALDEFDHALAVRRDDPWAHDDAGIAYRMLGESKERKGLDPTADYAAALARYRRATEIDPQYVFAWSNLAELEAETAERQSERREDPTAATDEAQRAADRGLAVDASYDLLLLAAGRAHVALVGYLVEAHRDPAKELAAARAALDRATKLRPTNINTWYYRAVAARREAESRLHRGVDARDALAAARAAVDEALRLRPRASMVYGERAELGIVVARATSNEAALTAARADADKAIELDGDDAGARLVAARVCLAQARHGDRAAIEAGLAHVDAALARDPKLPRAGEIRDELVRLR